MHGRILIVDDDQTMCKTIEVALRPRQFETSWRISAEEALLALKNETFDVVLTDLSMPGLSGIELCERIAANRPDVPVVVMTAFGSLETAIAAIRAGAYDFITKPVEMNILALTLERAARHRSLQEKVKVLSEVVEQSRRFEELLGESPPMRVLYDKLNRIADSEATVLITGESGTGKELVAKAIHKRSRRHERPFVAVNCAALPDALLESELFGHVKGAFTDARTDRKGLFLQAKGGTLFLDEIGELPLGLQPKLLRALEEYVVRPIGSDKELPFDARIVFSTNRDLESAVEEGRFRKDLFFRINVINLTLPPLRARGTDALLLTQHFLELFAARSGKTVVGISDALAGKLLNYTWPGNVRELRNAVERAVALTHFEKLAVEDFPEKMRDYQTSHIIVGSNDPTELVPMEEVERRYILHVLETVGGHRTLAAQVLGFDRKTLYRKLLRYGVLEEDKSL
ncbi:MAG: sigma-54-dependent Fis family transcriptional regulator [Pirellulales bacterium]|nr:sigma-54-dependent Fis family transcriptional regulator [Pirellulales bacterium]